MADVIVVLIVVILLVFAVKSSIKHFKGKGPCCGGGFADSGKKAKEKILDGPVIGRKTIKISGMHCQNCVNSVTNALNEIDGVSAKASLSDGSVSVSYDRTVNESELKQAVQKAGYEVLSIS